MSCTLLIVWCMVILWYGIAVGRLIGQRMDGCTGPAGYSSMISVTPNLSYRTNVHACTNAAAFSSAAADR